MNDWLTAKKVLIYFQSLAQIFSLLTSSSQNQLLPFRSILHIIANDGDLVSAPNNVAEKGNVDQTELIQRLYRSFTICLKVSCSIVSDIVVIDGLV